MSLKRLIMSIISVKGEKFFLITDESSMIIINFLKIYMSICQFHIIIRIATEGGDFTALTPTHRLLASILV